MKAPYVTHGFQTMLKYKPQLLDARTNTMNRVALLKSLSAFLINLGSFNKRSKLEPESPRSKSGCSDLRITTGLNNEFFRSLT